VLFAFIYLQLDEWHLTLNGLALLNVHRDVQV